MGNKQQSGGVVPADGMRVEFDLARKAGLHCLPIGASGSISSEFWKEMMGDLKTAFPRRDDSFYSLYKQLGQAVDNPLELMEPILNIIDILRKE
jgi:hypothetical protein